MYSQCTNKINVCKLYDKLETTCTLSVTNKYITWNTIVMVNHVQGVHLYRTQGKGSLGPIDSAWDTRQGPVTITHSHVLLLQLVFDRRHFDHFDRVDLRKKKVPFSMFIGNGKLMHECFPKHSRMGTARMK